MTMSDAHPSSHLALRFTGTGEITTHSCTGLLDLYPVRQHTRRNRPGGAPLVLAEIGVCRSSA